MDAPLRITAQDSHLYEDTEIRLVTTGNPNTVGYRLEYQRRYEIYWNEEKSVEMAQSWLKNASQSALAGSK